MCALNRAEEEEARPEDLYEVGTLVMIKRMMRTPDAIQLIVQGTERVKVLAWEQVDPFLRARVQVLPELRVVNADEVEALQRNLRTAVERALALLQQVPPEVRAAAMGADDPVQIAYFIASILNLGLEEEQTMLEADTVDELLRRAYARLTRELEIMQLRSKIASEAQTEMDKAQRDYVLRQQLKAIQKELGEDEGGEQARGRVAARAAQRSQPARRRAQRGRARTAPHGAAAVGRARLPRHPHVS